MSKAKFQAAKELIQQKRYDEARAILKTIDDPQAAKWLARLNEVSPEKKSGSVMPFIIVVAVIILVLTGVVIALLLRPQPEAPTVAEQPTLAQPSSVLTTYTPTPDPQRPTLPPTWTPESGVVQEQPVSDSGGSLGLFSGCGVYDWWDTDAERLTIRYLDIAETASQTSRIALASVLIELRDVQREFEDLDYPDCVSEIRDNISNGMDYGVTGFNDFLGQNDFLANADMSLANQYFADAYDLLLAEGVAPDLRMYDTGVFIWGGDSPTQRAYED